MTDSIAEPDLSLLAQIPDRDLEDIVASIHEGASYPGDALGFDSQALNAIENMALGYYRAKLYDRAAVLFGFVLQMNSGRGSAWRGLGACCQALLHFELAVRCYKAAVAADPDDIVSRVFWAECLCQAGERENGLELLEWVVNKGTKEAAFAPYLARAQAIINAKGGIPSRLVLMNAGKQLASDATELLAAEQGLTFDPEAEITAADIKKNPKLRGLLKELRQAVQQGKLTYAQVGGFTENELNGAYACACKYAEIGQVVEAIQIAGYLMFLDPHDGRYYQLVGICLQRIKQYENADEYYKMALIFDKNNPMSLVYRGESKIMAGQTDEGLRFVKQGVEAAGENPDFADIAQRGQVLLKQFSAKA